MKPQRPRKVLAWVLLLVATWMFVSPQALLGLNQLKWIHRYTFPGEVLIGALILCLSPHLFNFTPSFEKKFK